MIPKTSQHWNAQRESALLCIQGRGGEFGYSGNPTADLLCLACFLLVDIGEQLTAIYERLGGFEVTRHISEMELGETPGIGGLLEKIDGNVASILDRVNTRL